MVLTCYAMGYNLFGYTGLLSLGHALFFAAGMYGMSLNIQHLDWGAGPAVIAGLVAGFAMAIVIGMRYSHRRRRLYDRDPDVRAGWLPDGSVFRRWTRGDEGL